MWDTITGKWRMLLSMNNVLEWWQLGVIDRDKSNGLVFSPVRWILRILWIKMKQVADGLQPVRNRLHRDKSGTATRKQCIRMKHKVTIKIISDGLQPVGRNRQHHRSKRRLTADSTRTQTHFKRVHNKSQQTTHLMVSNLSTRTQTHFKRVHKQMSTSPNKQLIWWSPTSLEGHRQPLKREHKQMSTSHNKRHVMVSNQSRRTQKAPQRQAETFKPDSTSPAPSQWHNPPVWNTKSQQTTIWRSPTSLQGHRHTSNVNTNKCQLVTTTIWRSPPVYKDTDNQKHSNLPLQVRGRHNDTIHRFETQSHNKQQSDGLQAVKKDTDTPQTWTQTNVN